MSDIPIGPGTRVELNFSIKLENGERVDSTEGKAAVFEVGDGKLLPGFESALFGLKAGDSESTLIESERGFGLRSDDNIQILSRSRFPVNTELSEGLMFSFADPQSAELPGLISKIEGENITVDFNHPLAGRNLLFEVDIIKVEQISLEIIRA